MKFTLQAYFNGIRLTSIEWNNQVDQTLISTELRKIVQEIYLNSTEYSWFNHYEHMHILSVSAPELKLFLNTEDWQETWENGYRTCRIESTLLAESLLFWLKDRDAELYQEFIKYYTKRKRQVFDSSEIIFS